MGKGCIMLESYKEAAQYLPPLERLAYYESLMDYSFFGKEPEGLSPMAMGLFIMAKPTIDSAANRYTASVENGKKGGAPRGNQNAKKCKQQDGNGLNNQAKQPKQPMEQPEQPKQQYATTREDNQYKQDYDLDFDYDFDSEGESTVADKPPTRPRFSPPSAEEVATYCREKGYTIDPGRFVDYYASVGWKRGKNPIKDWRAAVRTWARRDSPQPATPEPMSCGYVLAPAEDPFEVAMRQQQEAGHV